MRCKNRTGVFDRCSQSKKNAAHLGGVLDNVKIKSALGELGSTAGGLEAVLLGFLRPQIVDITDFFEDDFLWLPMSTHTGSEKSNRI